MAANQEGPRTRDALVVSGAKKRFGSVQALAGASLSVRRGELVGLLGPNGAGKTTLIHAVSGRVRLDEGRIMVFGHDVSPAEARPEIGVVPQELAVYPLLTARENLEVFGSLYGVPAADLRGRVDWALEWSDLADRSKEPVKRFSGGMKRRLNIACSLLHQPSIVLLDEPTVGVDPQSRERIYDMLAELRARDVAIVLTTHHLEEAEQRCERIIIIDHGLIVADGTLAELVARTMGASRRLRVTLDAPLGTSAQLPAGAEIAEGRRIVVQPVRDIVTDVPALLRDIGAAGGQVAGVDLTGASLQDVFIALTGRELRE